MPNETLDHHVWGYFPERAKQTILNGVRGALASYVEGWDAFQLKTERELRESFGYVEANLALSKLGVSGSEAQIDICLKDAGCEGILVHISGRQTPRHEKELLEIIAVVTCNNDYRYGTLILRLDNKLKLESNRSSYAYCTGALIRLLNPILNLTPLKGILFVGYNAPI